MISIHRTHIVMINQITIQNFKSVVNASFPLSTFNVMIGANGCGKSNILEAIAIAAASSSNKLDYEYFANRGIRVVDPQFMLPAFEDMNASEIHLHIETNENDVSDFKIRYNKDTKPPRWEDANLSYVEFAELLKKNNVQTKNDLIKLLEGENPEIILNIIAEAHDGKLSIKPTCKDLLNFTIYSLEETILRKADNDNRLYPLGRHGEGLFAYLKNLASRENATAIMQEIIENLEILDWFDGMEIPEAQLSSEFNIKLHDRYIDEAISYFDQRSTNEGFLYLLFYLTLIISDETPTFFAIENIDASFNPKLCREVVKRLTALAKKHGKQIIATTHNPSVLDGLDIMDEDHELLVVRRNIDGYTKVNNVETKGMLNMSLSEAWLKGFIGGLPDNF